MSSSFFQSLYLYIPHTFSVSLTHSPKTLNPLSHYLQKEAKTMNHLQSWPEPVVRVQALSESGLTKIPDRYIKPVTDRPSPKNLEDTHINIPVIDLQNLLCNNQTLQYETLSLISSACKEWGFFQVVNHGVSHELMKQARETWREFFDQPLDLKQKYANSPSTYEGYGSRLGVDKGAKLDWSDYFFLHYMPASLRNQSKWPAKPQSCRYVWFCLFV